MSRLRLTGSGGDLGWLEFAVDERGFAELVRFARSFGQPAFAIEGTGSYGASLARALLAEGFNVFECERTVRRRRRGKNDLVDAELAAGRLLTGAPLPLPRGGVSRERLRLLLIERRSDLTLRLPGMTAPGEEGLSFLAGDPPSGCLWSPTRGSESSLRGFLPRGYAKTSLASQSGVTLCV
jgi:hypothetical protein